jgi:hypothetical protein
MPVYGVQVPVSLGVPPYGTTGEWKVYGSLGLETSGFLWETEPIPLSFAGHAAFDRGFYSVTYEQSGRGRINVHKTNLKTGITDLVHYVGTYGGADQLYVASITCNPDGNDIWLIWTTSADGWLMHLERSSNYGATWSSVSRPTFDGLDDPFWVPMWRIAKYPTWLFRGDAIDANQIYRSFDDGLTWQPNINIPPGTYCSGLLPKTFLNYETILLRAPQSETYFPGEASRIYTLNLETGVITDYLIADNEVAYLNLDNARPRSFGTILRMDSQPPAMTESHGPRDDPPIISTELGLITNTEASTFVALTQSEWQNIKDCYGFPVPQVLGGTSANSYLCFNRNGTVGVVMPKIPGVSSVDFWFNTGDEKLYGVEVPAAGNYEYDVPALWALNDINREVVAGQLWDTPDNYNYPPKIFNTANFDRGFYTLSREGVLNSSYIYRLRKTDVFAAPYTEIIYEITYAAYSSFSLICSKDGQEILISFYTTGGGGAAPSITYRSFDGGETFSIVAKGVTGAHRYTASSDALFWLHEGDSDYFVRSLDFAETSSGIYVPGNLYEQHPIKPTFYYGNKTIQMSLVPGLWSSIIWSTLNFSSGVVVSTTPMLMDSGNASVPLKTSWLSFGCCYLPPSAGGYAQTVNSPVLVSANETIYYNSRDSVIYGTTQPIKDCYGFQIDKTYGLCRGASTIVFNESGTIGLAPNIDGDFLIYLAPDYSQFFTSFVLSAETNLRPE